MILVLSLGCIVLLEAALIGSRAPWFGIEHVVWALIIAPPLEEAMKMRASFPQQPGAAARLLLVALIMGVMEYSWKLSWVWSLVSWQFVLTQFPQKTLTHVFFTLAAIPFVLRGRPLLGWAAATTVHFGWNAYWIGVLVDEGIWR